MRNCVKCGEEFKAKSDIHFFCSDKCRRDARGSEYRKQRALALLRDGYACTECDATEPLECHHKTPVCKGGDHALSNLQTLCRPCHKAKHKKWSSYSHAQTESERYDHAA